MIRFFIFAGLMFLQSLTAFAAFPPVLDTAASGLKYCATRECTTDYWSGQFQYFSTPEQAVNFRLSVEPNTGLGTTSISCTPTSCFLDLYRLSDGYTWVDQTIPVTQKTFPNVYACPVNSTGTTSCVCNSGFNQSGSSCIPVTNQSIVDAMNLIGEPFVGSGGGLSFCYAGAPMVATGSAYNPADPTGTTEYYGPFKLGSGDCSSVAQATKPIGAAACKPNQYFGQVNGVDTCVNGASTSVSTSAVAPAAGASGATPSLGSAAPSGAVSSVTTGSCLLDGTCTFQTDYKNNSGVVIGSSTVTKPADPALDNCAKNPNTVACASFGTPAGVDLIPSISSGFTGIVPVAFTSASFCPQPLSVNAMGKDFSFSYSGACDAITAYLAPILLLLSAGLAAWIFVGGFKS